MHTNRPSARERFTTTTSKYLSACEEFYQHTKNKQFVDFANSSHPTIKFPYEMPSEKLFSPTLKFSKDEILKSQNVRHTVTDSNQEKPYFYYIFSASPILRMNSDKDEMFFRERQRRDKVYSYKISHEKFNLIT